MDAEHVPITMTNQQGNLVLPSTLLGRSSPPSCSLYTEPQASTFKSYLKVKKENEKMNIWYFSSYIFIWESNAIASGIKTNI